MTTDSKNISKEINDFLGLFRSHLSEYQEYIKEITEDLTFDKNLKLENENIKRLYNIDIGIDTCDEEVKKEERKKYRDLINEEISSFEDLDLTTGNENIIFWKLCKTVTTPEFKEFFQLISDMQIIMHSDMVSFDEAKKIKNHIVNELAKKLKSSVRIRNFSREISYKVDQRYLDAITKLTSDDWCIASMSGEIITLDLDDQLELSNILHKAIGYAFGCRETKEPDIALINTNKIKILFENVPVDIWLCPWYILNDLTPIQYLASLIDPKYIENAFLRKKIAEVINHFKKNIGDKYGLRLVVPKETKKVTPVDLTMFFKEIPIEDDFIVLDNWN